ncbi:MAG: MOSC domain-containing protein [Anaerolineales bacterium]|nr:MOSC domain-containing protein [Anaerolineales bacterium]
MIIGTITHLNIYPVKSMGGLSVNDAIVYWYGINGDRKYAFVQSGNPGGFPWLTARQVPKLVQYRPYFLDEGERNDSRIHIVTPSGAEYQLQSDELKTHLEALYQKPVHLMHLFRGTWDAHSISLISHKTIETISAEHGSPLTTERFRMNIVVDTDAVGDIPENAWAGKTLVFGDGDVEIRFDRRTVRCSMVNVDPASAEVNTSVLKTIAQNHEGQLGLYGSVVKVGKLHVGDKIRLK